MIATVTALGLLAIVALCAAGVGGALLGKADATGRERLVFGTALGVGALGYAILALGLLKLARPVPLWSVTLLLGAVGLFFARRQRAAEDPSEPAPRLLTLASGTAVALGLLCALVGALAPPAGWEWDALSYHLAGPKTYLREGRVFYIPYDHHTNFPFTLNMLFMLMLSAGSVAAAKLVHWLCGLLLIASVDAFARRHLPRGATVGAVGAAILAGTPIILWEASVAYVDLATALFAWLSVYALVNAAQRVERGDSVRWLIVSALLMGFALGTKMTCLAFWGMGMLGLLGWHRLAKGTWAKETIPHAALWGALSLLVGSVWYVKTWLYTGNPVYPFFYSLLGGRYWGPENAAQYATDQAALGMGKGALELLLGPWRVTNEMAFAIAEKRPWIFTEYVSFGLSPVYVAALLALPLVLRRVSWQVACLLLYGLGVFVFWFFLMQQTRYLVPALPAFALLAALVLIEARPIVRVAGGALVAVSALWGIVRVGSDIAAPAVPVVLGQQPPERYLARRLGPLATAQLWINANTRSTARVALFDDPRGYYLDRPYAWAEPNHALGLFGWEAYTWVDDFLADFRRRGYTLLLQNRENVPADPARRATRWRELLDEAAATGKLRTLQEFGPVIVYEIPTEGL